MKLVNVSKVEDCFDGSIIFEYKFSRKISENFVKRLGEGGRIHYYPEFTRPFFKIFDLDGIQVKGIVGDKNFQAVFPRTDRELKMKRFDDRLALIMKGVNI